MIGWEPTDPRDRLAAEIARTSGRLRNLPLARLSAPLPPYASPADAARCVAQRLAEAAQGIEERAGPAPPSWRRVPRLADHAASDQVAVTGRELLDALAAAEADAEVWTPTGRRGVREVAEAEITALRDLRLAL